MSVDTSGAAARPRLGALRSRWPEILLFATLVVVYMTGVRSFGMLAWDEAEYATLARSLAGGDGYGIGGQPNTHRVPVVPLALALPFALGAPATDLVARATAALLAVLALLAVWLSLRSRVSRVDAALATLLCAVAPAFWSRTTAVMTDVLFAGLFAATIWAFMRALEVRPEQGPDFRAAAALAAVAFLTRYTAVLFFPAAVALSLVAVARDRSAWRRIVSPNAPGAVAIALALLAPWFVRCALVTGDPWSGLRWAVAQVPSYAPSLSVPWFYYLLELPRMLSVPAACFVITGIAVCLARRDRFAADSALAAAVLVVSFSFFRFKEDRFILAAVPLLAPAGVVGLRFLARALAGARDELLAVGAAVLLTIGLSTGPVRRSLSSWVTNGYPALLEAAAYIRESTPPGTIVLSAIEPQAAWYTGRPTAALPADPARPLADADSVALLVSFERGQPPWATAVLPRAGAELRCGARMFHDGRFAAAVIRADCLDELMQSRKEDGSVR